MTIKIPLEKLREGIQYSLKKSEEHLVGAEVLIERNLLSGAVALIEFAIEEFGRAQALREKLRKGSEDVERSLFSSHDYKYEKAWTVLPEELKTIYEGTFDTAVLGEATLGEMALGETVSGVEKETISPRTRLDATFVNYDEHEKEWKVGVPAEKEKLEIIIKGIREHIRSF